MIPKHIDLLANADRRAIAHALAKVVIDRAPKPRKRLPKGTPQFIAAKGNYLVQNPPGGTAAFIGVGAAAVAVLLAADGIDHHWALWVGIAVAGVVELASIPPDDNLAIPLLAGTAMFLLGV